MNRIDDNFPGDDDHRFDLLVDGELNEAERRELLSGLDDEPGGWRRCALAFLEAEAWKRDFGSIVKEPAPLPSTRRPTQRSWLVRHRGTLLAMAACFLMALLLGVIARDMVRGPKPADSPMIEVAGGTSQTEVKSAVPQPAPAEDLPSELPQPPETPSSPWSMVTLSAPEGPDGRPQSIRLPAMERESLDAGWLENLPAAVPADVMQALNRTGHQVRQRRGLFPLQMKDGRRLIVPVDEVDIHYVGRPAL